MNNEENEWSEWEQYRKLKLAEHDLHTGGKVAADNINKDNKNLLEDISAARTSYWEGIDEDIWGSNLNKYRKSAIKISEKMDNAFASMSKIGDVNLDSKTKSELWLQELYGEDEKEYAPVASHANPEYWKTQTSHIQTQLDAIEYAKQSIALKKAARNDSAEPKAKRPRYPSYKKNDRVTTPNGLGNVWSVEKDGTVCVELDSNPSILHEFEKKEIKKSK